jgi:hypothetical protein
MTMNTKSEVDMDCIPAGPQIILHKKRAGTRWHIRSRFEFM